MCFLKGSSYTWAPSAFTLVREKNISALKNMPLFTLQQNDRDYPILGSILLLPEYQSEPGKEWHGLPFPLAVERVLQKAPDLPVKLGTPFWEAFLRGGIQGGVWLLETCKSYIESGRTVDMFIKGWMDR
jgi:hypothetical protein